MSPVSGAHALNDFDFYRIQGMSLFADIPGLDKQALGRLGARLGNYGKGDVVFEQGSKVTCVGFLLSGEVEGGFNMGGYYQMIDRFKTGDTFGEAAAMRLGHVPVEVRALVPSEVLFIDVEPLLHSPNDPVICTVLSRVCVDMTRKMAVLMGKVRMLRNPMVVGRVADLLLSRESDADGCVSLGITQMEMGEYLGLSRSRVSSALSSLMEAGMIDQPDGRGVYRILDRESLEFTVDKGRMPIEGEAGADAGAGDGAGGADGAGEVTPAEVHIDSTKTMREIVADEPLFEKFLQYKGFPFTVENPITAVVTFDDVSTMQGLDKAAFIAEFAVWKAQHS